MEGAGDVSSVQSPVLKQGKIKMSASFWHRQKLSEFIKTADSGADCTAVDKLSGQVEQASQHTGWKKKSKRKPEYRQKSEICTSA